MKEIEKVSELIAELQRLMGLHGDVHVESFFEGCVGGMNVHYEPGRPAQRRGNYDGYFHFEEDEVPATIYIGEQWYG